MSRKGDWFLTFSGVRFFPLDPKPEDVFIEDIAHALSMACRFGGHCRFHYSVGQHSILVSEHASQEEKLEALLHDASEAYISDIVRPLKIHMPQYLEIEHGLELAIAERFKLKHPWSRSIKELDNRALLTEKRDIITRTEDSWTILDEIGEPLEPFKDQITQSSPELTEYVFLNTFKKLSR